MVKLPWGSLPHTMALLETEARLNADGGLDTSFNPESVQMMSLCHIDPAGWQNHHWGVSSYNGISRNNLARLNADGSLDTVLTLVQEQTAPFLPHQFNQTEKLLLEVLLISYDGTVRSRVARINGGASL
jgi:hypothetical protein